MTNVYTVYQDGRPLKRGLSRSNADRYAQYLSSGYDSHRANDKRRTAEFTVKIDSELVKEFDDNYSRHR
jgi:hypothetical protein